MIDASACPSCDRIATPPEPRCLACRADTQTTQLPAQGRVLTYTRQEAWVALVELEGGARVLARFDAEPAVGDEVGLALDQVVAAQG